MFTFFPQKDEIKLLNCRRSTSNELKKTLSGRKIGSRVRVKKALNQSKIAIHTVDPRFTTLFLDLQVNHACSNKLSVNDASAF